jgi:type IV pilus assembly protein PilQ
MSNIRVIAVFLLFVGVFLKTQVNAQSGNSFDTRLENIRVQLDVLSDSLALGLNESANFSVSGLSIQAFLRTLAESHDLNIQVDPSINITLTNNFTSVRVKEIIYFLCQEYQLDIRFINSIMSFTKYLEPSLPKQQPIARKLRIQFDPSTRTVSFDLAADSLRAVVKEITRISDRNVVASGGTDVENKLVTGYIRGLSLENALDKLAYTNGLRLTRTKDDVFIFEANQVAASFTPNNFSSSTGLAAQRITAQGDIVVKDSLISVDVVNYPILEVINQVSSQLGINYIMFSEITGNTTAKVKRARYSEMLSFLFQGTNYTFKKRDGVYLIGQRNQEGFRVTELVKLDFRTI